MGLAEVERFIREHEPHLHVVPSENDLDHQELVDDAARRLGFGVEREGKLSIYTRHGKTVGGLFGMLPSSTTPIADRICRSKAQTKIALRGAGLPVPEGRLFGLDHGREALRYARAIGWPVAVKPDSLRAGIGITTDVRGANAFRAAWDDAVSAKGARVAPTSILVERHIAGLDLRLLVVGNCVVATTVRVLPHVVGDGRSTVRRLLSEKDELRLQNSFARDKPILVQPEFMAAAGWALEDVPDSGQVAFVGGRGNVDVGADHVDATDLLSSELADMAVRAVEAVPGIDIAGVDILARSPDEPDGAAVIELNTRANIRLHHHPWSGRVRDAAAEIVRRTADRT